MADLGLTCEETTTYPKEVLLPIKLPNKIWKKPIENPLESPWLDWIAIRKKKYEGRVYRAGWTKVSVGDIIIFHCETLEVKVVVTKLKQFKNFGDAFEVLKEKLIPIKGITKPDVEKIYLKYFNQKDIDEHGVVAIGIKPVLYLC